MEKDNLYEQIFKLLQKAIGILIAQKTLLSISEAALYLETSKSFVYRLLQKNKDIICIKESGIRKRIVKSTLDKHFEERIKLAIEKKERDEEEIKRYVDEILPKYLDN